MWSVLFVVYLINTAFAAHAALGTGDVKRNILLVLLVSDALGRSSIPGFRPRSTLVVVGRGRHFDRGGPHDDRRRIAIGRSLLRVPFDPQQPGHKTLRKRLSRGFVFV